MTRETLKVHGIEFPNMELIGRDGGLSWGCRVCGWETTTWSDYFNDSPGRIEARDAALWHTERCGVAAT